MRATDSQIFLNIKWAPILGMPPLELTNNEISGLPTDWDCNHTSNGLEIINEKLDPILQFYYKDDTHLVLNGAITFTNEGRSGVIFISPEEGVSVQSGVAFSKNELFKKVQSLHLKRLFKYPAWKYRGQFDENPN